MKRIIILIIFIPMIAYAEEWDQVDKMLFGLYSSALSIDVLQTNYLFEHNYKEVNPIVREWVRNFGENSLPLCIGLGLTGVWMISDHISSENRKLFLGVMTIIESAVVIRNDSIGIGLSFKY